MSVIRVHKNKNYTIMANYHLMNKELSLKAKGLLCLILSLPDDWKYSVRGLTSICKESKATISTCLQELESHGFLERTMTFENGKINGCRYDIYEKPLCPKNQSTDNQDTENYDIYKELNEQNTDLINHICPPSADECDLPPKKPKSDYYKNTPHEVLKEDGTNDKSAISFVNFELIYAEYPKKVGKQKAFQHYVNLRLGVKKTSTGTVKLSNKEIFDAMIKYLEEKGDTEIQYLNQFDVFLNTKIYDYLEE